MEFAAALEEHVRATVRGPLIPAVASTMPSRASNFFAAPVWPDFLLTNERDIYRRTAEGGWEPYGDWNSISRRRHDELFQEALEMFAFVEQLAQESDYIDDPL